MQANEQLVNAKYVHFDIECNQKLYLCTVTE